MRQNRLKKETDKRNIKHNTMTDREINIKDYDYELPEERIAKFPPAKRGDSKLLFWDGAPHCSHFDNIEDFLPEGATLVFNNTKVIRARLMFFKDSGARIEIFCLEPHAPADYERAFAATDSAEWICMVGNLRKWKEGALKTEFTHEGVTHTLSAERVGATEKEQIVRFTWSNRSLTFGQMLELLGRIPIPPYLNRESREEDNTRYQTVYSKFEGSVAAPTAGLHFTDEMLERLSRNGHPMAEVTLHVGAGTFLPVKSENAAEHHMHVEHFSVRKETVKKLIDGYGNIIAVGTTSVRTLESLPALGYRIMKNGSADYDRTIGQWESYDIPENIGGKELLESLYERMDTDGMDKIECSTRIMITPPYKWRVIRGMFTNFHQPQSTLLLLVSALIGDGWRDMYRFAMDNGFRFLSYGDSSLLLPPKETK